MEQFVRDNRINMIYEGTNAVQSLDLLGRKILGNNGESLKKFGRQIAALAAEVKDDEQHADDMQEFITPLTDLGQKMTAFTTEIGMRAMQSANEVGAASPEYLRVAGHLVFGYFFARMAYISLQALSNGASSGDTNFYQGKLQTARFYFAKLMPETLALMATARTGAAALMDTEAALV